MVSTDLSLTVTIVVLSGAKSFVDRQKWAARRVFEPHGIELLFVDGEVKASKSVVEMLLDLEVSLDNNVRTKEQNSLLQFADPDPKRITAFFLRSIRPSLQGWSDIAQRCVVVATERDVASQWVLAHEIGHVLLDRAGHVQEPGRLMLSGGQLTDKVFFRDNQCPLLVWSELSKIRSSTILVNVSARGIADGTI